MTERGRPGFGVLVAVAVVAAVIAAFIADAQQQRAQAWLRHTLVVERAIDRTLIDVQAAEGTQRTFLLSGAPAFAEAYRRREPLVARDSAELARLTADNPRQRAYLNVLDPHLEERLRLARLSVELKEGGQLSASLANLLVERGASESAAIRSILDRMIAEENRLSDIRTRQVSRLVLALQIILAVLAVVLAVAAASILADTRRRLTESLASQARLEALNAALAAEAEARGRAEEQLAHLQRLESLGQLTGGIAHDFNNMLAVIIGSLDLARSRFESHRERALVYIDNAIEGAQRAAQLTSRLLAFSRRQSLSPEILEVNRFVADASELLRRTLGDSVKVETVLGAGLWPAVVDPAQLESAIVNLALNARDAMGGAGRLTLETANASLDEAYAASQRDVAPGDYVMVAVTDTGGGMSPELAARAFEPFFTTKETGKGTGLGLSQVYGFVKQTGGHVAIYSELGRGTSVKLYLPRAEGLPSPSTARAARAPAAPIAPTGRTVLVVEDEPIVRQVSVEGLRGLGYAVREAAGAREALDDLEAHGPVDLLFTDVVMPETTGRELADEATRRWPQLKVLYTTGYTRNAIVHNGVLDEGVAVLPKPFTLDELAAKVREALEG